MGYFSWKTQDTNRSISNRDSNVDTFRVIMTDNKSNQWVESNYDGYGRFDDKDFYELLAEMNGLQTREEGIDLEFSGKEYTSPSLSENGAYYNGKAPKSCELQGFFYVTEEDEDEDYFEDEE